MIANVEHENLNKNELHFGFIWFRFNEKNISAIFRCKVKEYIRVYFISN